MRRGRPSGLFAVEPDMKIAARTTAFAFSGLVALMALGAPGCERDATAEVESWKAKACACEEEMCGQEQRREFWRLVREFRNESPSDAEAQQLAHAIDEGQACLSAMSIDIYAANAGN